MPTARHHLAAAALGGQLYVAGGRNREDQALDAFERFDPEAQKWERLAPLPLAVGAADAVATEDAFVVTGGDDELSWREGGGYVTPAVWAYVPAESRWRRLPDLGTPRHAHAAAIAGGRVYVFGGVSCPGFGELSTVESLRLPGDLGG
jgi:N-acetylneuraminic acid mutarotase